MPFSWRPTSCLLIESQTLTIWIWNDLDLGMTLTSDKSNQVKPMPRKKISIFHEMTLTQWPNDHDTQTWPRYCQDVPPHQTLGFYVNYFKSYSLNRERDRLTHRHQENIASTTHIGGNNDVYCYLPHMW